MKFNCGLSCLEKTQLKKQQKEKYLYSLHYKFAWFPIKLNTPKNTCVWLEIYKRKATYISPNHMVILFYNEYVEPAWC